MDTHDLSSSAVARFIRTIGGDLPGGPKNYIPRVVNLYERRRAEVHFKKMAEKQGIFELLGIPSLVKAATNELRARPPFLALLVGRYGVGKTECLLRFCQKLASLDSRDSGSSIYPFPINLAQCRHRNAILESDFQLDDFIDFLLAGMDLDEKAREEFLSGMQKGYLFLLLDGLDEVIDSDLQHEGFFVGLSAFLGEIPNVRAVVTTRREYLSLRDPACKTMLQHFRTSVSVSPLNVYSLELDAFNDAEIDDYLERRLGTSRSKELLESLGAREKRDLRTILYKPLHLRVFSDLADGRLMLGEDHPERAAPLNLDHLLRATTEMGGSLDKPTGVASLFHYYIEQVSLTARLRQKELGAHYTWDNKKLAAETVGLFRKGEKDVMEETNIRNIRVPLEVGDNAEEPLLLAIHKCPFLTPVAEATAPIEQNRYRVRFSLKAFYEFFTVSGIVMEFEDVGRKVEAAPAFNNLVVNSDMRKFLRGMVYDFDELIEFSCGLRNPEYWPGLALEEHKDWLRKILVSITRGMTDPENSDADIERNIHEFLGRRDVSSFDPGYLRYCYHAVATYLITDGRRNESGWRDAWASFESKVRESQKEALAVLNGEAVSEVPPVRWQLLVERCVDFSVKLHQDWARPYLEKIENLMKRGGWETDSRTRMTHMLWVLKLRS